MMHSSAHVSFAFQTNINFVSQFHKSHYVIAQSAHSGPCEFHSNEIARGNAMEHICARREDKLHSFDSAHCWKCTIWPRVCSWWWRMLSLDGPLTWWDEVNFSLIVLFAHSINNLCRLSTHSERARHVACEYAQKKLHHIIRCAATALVH